MDYFVFLCKSSPSVKLHWPELDQSEGEDNWLVNDDFSENATRTMNFLVQKLGGNILFLNDNATVKFAANNKVLRININCIWIPFQCSVEGNWSETNCKIMN